MRITFIPSHPARTAMVGLAAALAVTACGSGDDPTLSGSGSTASSTASTAGAAAAFNDADVAFITDMKPHHEAAIDMAELAASRAGNAQVKDLALRIVGAQDPEIRTMEKLATEWGVTLESAMGGAPHSGGGMGGGDVAALEPLSGAAFDMEFLSRMTVHHRSAVEMSQKELTAGKSTPAKELAQQIIAVQQKEIAEMTALLAAL